MATRQGQYVNAPGDAQDAAALLTLSGKAINNPLTAPDRWAISDAVQPRPDMNAHHEMSHEEIARTRLEVLRREHRDLDEAIAALSQHSLTHSLTLQRLKKQKLSLKDRIARLEDELTPDIIA
jgi:hypothetical protein